MVILFLFRQPNIVYLFALNGLLSPLRVSIDMLRVQTFTRFPVRQIISDRLQQNT